MRVADEEMEALHGDACTCTVCNTIRAALGGK